MQCTGHAELGHVLEVLGWVNALMNWSQTMNPFYGITQYAFDMWFMYRTGVLYPNEPELYVVRTYMYMHYVCTMYVICIQCQTWRAVLGTDEHFGNFAWDHFIIYLR